LGPYRRVLRAPHVVALLVAALGSRLHHATFPLACVLLVEAQTGSYAAAGLVAGASALGDAAAQVFWGRRMDRTGQRRAMLTAVSLLVAGELALLVLALSGAPLPALVAAAAAGGFGAPPTSAALRVLWPRVLPDPDAMRTGLALDAMTTELVFVGGPVLVVAVVALASPAVVIVLTTLATVGGVLLFVAQPPSRATRGGQPVGRFSLASPGLRTILVAAVATGLVFGTLEVALPAFAEDETGDPERGAFVFAAQAVGSLAGGLVYGARATGRNVVALYVGLVALLAPSVALLAAAGSLSAMLALGLVGGLVLAPMTAAGNEVIGHVVEERRLGEAFGLVITAVVVGAAAGNALAGVVVEEAGWRASVLASAGVLLAASAVVAARQVTLKRPPALAQSSR